MSTAPAGGHRVQMVWDAGCRLAESPVWDAESRQVYFVDQDGGRILRLDERTQARKSWALPGRVASIGLCGSGRLIVALARRIVFFDTRTGGIEDIIPDIDEPPGNRLNDGKVGPDGCFWVGSRDTRLDSGPVSRGSGRLYRVSAEGKLECKARGYVISNGLAWSADHRRMYHADSHRGRIDVWDFDAGSGEIANRRCFAEMSIAEGLPDGAACDVDGCYWSAAPSAGCVNKFSPGGELVDRIDLPCEAPTMVCFARDWMYVTCMKQKPGMPRSRRKFDGGGLYRLPAPAVGVAVSRLRD